MKKLSVKPTRVIDSYSQPAAMVLLSLGEPDASVSKETGLYPQWISAIRLALKESPGILPFFLRCWLLFQTRGLNLILEVAKGEDPGCRNSDHLIHDFIHECCICEPGAKENSSVLYTRFIAWYRQGNVGVRDNPTSTWFGRRMSQHFRKTKRSHIFYHGIRLVDLSD